MPTSFSEQSTAALRLAMRVAVKYSSAIDLLHVLPLPRLTQHSGNDDATRIDALIHSEQTSGLAKLRLYATACDVPAEFRLRLMVAFGRARDVICVIGAATTYDLVVMGAGRRSLTSWLLGGTTDAVVDNVPCPVLTVSATRALEEQSYSVDTR